MKKVKILIKRKEGAKDIPLPRYVTPGSSGMDLCADVPPEGIILNPHEIKLISCGIYLGIPAGYEAEVRPRSGLSLKHGITLVNAPGTIDSDYRGLVSLIMTNLGAEPYKIRRKERVAQLVIKEVIRAEFVENKKLSQTARAEGGFGHTGE